MSILSTNTKLIKVGQEYSAGSGISIDDYVISVTATLTGDYASQSAFDELSDSFSSLSSNINTNSGVWDDVVNKLYISSYHELSAGANTDIQGYVISSRNWTPDITYTSESAYQRATNYTDTQISSLSGEVSAEVSHLSSDIDYISGVALTSHQSLEGYATESFVENVSGDITALIPTNYYPDNNPSGFITGVDLTPYQTIEGMTAYQPVGDYATTNELEQVSADITATIPSTAGLASESYVQTNSAVLTGMIDAKQDTLTFGYDEQDRISEINNSAVAGGNIPVSNSGDLYKLEFDGIDLYGLTSTSSSPIYVYSAVSSRVNTGINYVSTPNWDNVAISPLYNWSAFDIIAISSNGWRIYSAGYPYGLTALDVYYSASYLYDYNNHQLNNFSGYVGKITRDSLFISSYFDKPSYYNNIKSCNNFKLWFSGNYGNAGNLNQNQYICSVGNKVESGTSKVEGIIVPGTVDLSPYYTTADANTLSSMLSGAIDYVSANAGKVYEGVSPIVVNNTEDKISADTWTFSAGSNVSFVDDNVNKITRIDCTVTGYNETVLYSSTQDAKTTAFTLSEPLTAFEKVRFEITGYTHVYAEDTHQTPSAINEEISTCFTYYCKSSDANPLQMIMGTYSSNDGLNYGVARSKFLYMNTDGTTWNGNTTDCPHIQKIIGINRKY